MRGFGALILTAGLASAVSIDSNARASQAAPVAEQASSSGQAGSIAGIFNNSSATVSGSQSSQSQVSSADSSFDPSSLDLGNVGGVNLGDINFSDQSSVASAILSMLNALCLGNIFDTSSILDLGVNDEMEMFLELVQLMQLEQLGFLNVSDIQSLLGSGFDSSLFSGSSSNVFDLGSFKRAVSERKKTMRRARLRRSPTRAKRQC